MGKAGGIIALIAGIFATIAALFTLVAGGLGSAFNAESGSLIVAFGWLGLASAFGVIVFGVVAMFKPSVGGFFLLALSLIGAAVGGTFVAVCLSLALIGGIFAALGAKSDGKRAYWPWLGAPIGLVLAITFATQMNKPSAPQVARAEQLEAVAPVPVVAASAPVVATEPVAAPAFYQVPVVAAAESGNAPDTAARACETSGEPNACAVEELAVADKALNVAYQAAMKRLDDDAKSKLRIEQRAWIKARDLECGDAMGQARTLACEADKTTERTAEITLL